MSSTQALWVRVSLGVLRNPIVLFLASYVAYCAAAGSFGLVTRGQSQVFTEVPLLIGLYVLLTQMLRPSRWRGLVAALPLASVYVAHDYHRLTFGTVPDWASVARVGEFFVVMGPAAGSALIACLALPTLVWMTQIDGSFFVRRRVGLLAVVVLLFASPVLFPSQVAHAARTTLALSGWSESRDVRYHGRLFMSLVREAIRRDAQLAAGRFEPIESSSLYVDQALLQTIEPRNVHLVVLEGFVDPAWFRGVALSRPAMHPSFTELVGSVHTSSLSPAFGGGTARAELEVLCGVPALGLYGTIEFSSFSGAQTYCLPGILADRGFLTQASHPYLAEFYNRFRAYPGLGFQERSFLETEANQDARALRRGSPEDQQLFDSDLYDALWLHVKSQLPARVPLLNYALTMYGHPRYPINTSRHAMLITIAPEVPWLERIANQMYYRSEALAQYLKALMDIDADSLIVVVGDHLPALAGGEATYHQLGFRGPLAGDTAERLRECPLYVFDRGVRVELPLIHHYDIYRVILDRLTNGAYCAAKSCHFERTRAWASAAYRQEYATVVGMAVRPAGADRGPLPIHRRIP